MLKKIEFNNNIWKLQETQRLPELITEFAENPSADTDIFDELVEYIWDAGVCKPIFFATMPYLIEIASNIEFDKAKDLWGYFGTWISTHNKYRHEISQEVLAVFDSALLYAEKICIKLLSQIDSISYIDAVYLYGSIFAFAKHEMGYITMSGYKDDIAGTSIAKCKYGHLNDVTVYNSGIVPYDAKEQPCHITSVDLGAVDYRFEKRRNNPWFIFEDCIIRNINNIKTSDEIRTHLELSRIIVNNGVKPNLPMKYAFSLYGSLLFCHGFIDESYRIFHGWDTIVCQECAEKFIFADSWCENY